MNTLDLLIARTQRNLTYLYWFLFTLVLSALVFLPRPLDASTNTVLQMLLAVLGTLITGQNAFWFARQRNAGVPDPSTTSTTTTTITTPSGDPDAIPPTLAPAPPVAAPERM